MHSFAVWGWPSAPEVVAPEQLMAAKGCDEEEPDSAGHHPGPGGQSTWPRPSRTGREDPGDIFLVSQHMHSCSSRTAHPVFLVCAHLGTGPSHREDLPAGAPATGLPHVLLTAWPTGFTSFYIRFYVCLQTMHLLFCGGRGRDRYT